MSTSKQQYFRCNLIGMLVALWMVLALVHMASAQMQSQISFSAHEEKGMTQRAKGSFDVKLSPQKPDNQEAERAALGRMSIGKQFHGDLEATSSGEMLGIMSQVKGSGGYVAMERVSGKLLGRSGSFVLQHSATMTRGIPQMNITVVPDSGTDQLADISGSLTIQIENGKHFYEFAFTFPTSQ